MKKYFMVFTLALIFLSLSGKAFGQDVLTTHNIFDVKSVAELALSPDKNFIAFTVNVPRPFTDASGGDYRELYVYDVRTQQTRPFITGKRTLSSIGWAPDGETITFRANFPDQAGTQVYGISLKGGEAFPMTRHTLGVNTFEFIDTNTLAITATGPADPAIGNYRRKGMDIEVFEEEWRHINLYIYNLITHETRQVTSDVTVFDFTLSPDKKWAAAAIAPQNLVDDSYMFKRIHLVNMQTGETTLLMENPGKLGSMAWSPDGKKIAFQSASKLEDAVVGSLFVMDVPTSKKFSELRNLVEGMELSVISHTWKDNNTVIFAAEEGVDITLSEQRVDLGSRSLLIEPGQLIFRGFTHVDGMIALAGNTPMHPSELFTLEMRRRTLTRHTNHNPWLSNIRLARQEKLEYSARDGMRIEGVLIYPLDYEAGKQYPLITYIHGGPEAAVQNGWFTGYGTWGQVAAARGYFVFAPNYRASSGRGLDFTMVGYGDLAGVEYDDVLDGIDHLINIGFVDRNRVGIGGGSYGGYFSAWSATRHTERFAAAVMFVGISNQVSKRHTTDIPWEDYYVHWGFWNHEDVDRVYASSPIKYAHNAKTPILILHGDSDPRVHPQQSLELYRAIKMHTETPVRLIWYKGEGHGNRRNTHRLDYIVRTMQWFDHFLKEGKTGEELPEKYPDLGF
jgi:dipeptidyl aminopeptidase/acylaminoacyl peptidase